MSKLSDYSKFDHLDSGSDDESDTHTDQKNDLISAPQTKVDAAEPPTPLAFQRLNPETSRISFLYNGTPIYEWEQHLGEVVIYVPAPASVPTSKIECTIKPNRLILGLIGAKDPFLNEQPYEAVEVSESTWVVEDGQIVIYLQKANNGVVWEAALKGRFNVRLGPSDLEKVKKSLMLERWQHEHPGMDFRDAEFNGTVPNPRTFMGGVNYE